jgi:hypothetical protein
MSKVKKSKILIPKTAKNCNVSEELVEDIINFYYSELRKEMESLNSYRIRVPVLGTFIITESKLSKSVKRLTDYINRGKPDNFSEIEKYNSNIETKNKQEKLLTTLKTDKYEREQKRKSLEK